MTSKRVYTNNISELRQSLKPHIQSENKEGTSFIYYDPIMENLIEVQQVYNGEPTRVAECHSP